MAMDYTPQIRRRIEDISRCPLCTEMLNDARFLPCGHTFCQRCIDQCRGSLIGTSCPTCRKNSVASLFRQLFFGRSDLPKNFIGQNLAEVVRRTRGNENNAAERERRVRALLPARRADRPMPGRDSKHYYSRENI